jgi:hypothetical protein
MTSLPLLGVLLMPALLWYSAIELEENIAKMADHQVPLELFVSGKI